MGRKGDSRRPQKPPIGEAAKAAFLAALRSGARREDAAEAAGYSIMAFYGARGRDAAFKASWAEALAGEPAARRRARAYEERGEIRIVPANRRLLQRRRMRHVRFDQARREAFLAHFAWSADARAAAAEAGVCQATVNLHRRKDPAFEAEYLEALDRAYVLLEAEALRQRLEAQRRLRDAIDASEPLPPSTGGMAEEFERVMKLLARWDRKGKRPEQSAKAGGRRRPWTFESAIALLEDRLKALAVPVQPLPTEEAARYDGEGTVTGDCPKSP